MLESLVRPISHPQGDRHDVVRVIVIGILAERPLEVIECAGVIAGIERDRCRVHPFGGRLRRSRLAGSLPLADAQVESRPFEQLPFFRIPVQDGPEKAGCALEIVALECLHPALVNRNGLVKARLSRGRRRGGLRRDRDRDSRPGSRRTRFWLGGDGLSSCFLDGFDPFDAPDSLG